jgi:hypothetical protein
MSKSETKTFDVTFGCYETKITGDETSRVDLRAIVTADGEFFAADAISYGAVGTDGIALIRGCFAKVEAAAKAAGAKKGRLAGIAYPVLVKIEGVWAQLHADLAQLGVDRLAAAHAAELADEAKPEKKPRKRRVRRTRR